MRVKPYVLAGVALLALLPVTWFWWAGESAAAAAGLNVLLLAGALAVMLGACSEAQPEDPRSA